MEGQFEGEQKGGQVEGEQIGSQNESEQKGSQNESEQKSAPRCPHGKLRHLEKCLECWESMLKESRRLLVKCRAEGKRRRNDACIPCEHCAEKRRCKVCKGSWICSHGHNKVYCKACDGRRLCQVCWDVTLPRCYEVCAKCRRQAEHVALVRGESLESVLRASGVCKKAKV